jgi:hypothetical protein
MGILWAAPCVALAVGAHVFLTGGESRINQLLSIHELALPATRLRATMKWAS